MTCSLRAGMLPGSASPEPVPGVVTVSSPTAESSAPRPCDPQPNRAEHRGKTALIVPVAISARLPRSSPILRPARIAIAQAFRLQFEKLLPRLPGSPVQISPETLLQVLHKMLEPLVDRYNMAMECRSPFGMALACEAKANLHPLALYTSNVTSLRFPTRWTRSSVQSSVYAE